MFKNTSVDVVFKIAISSDHLRHTLIISRLPKLTFRANPYCPQHAREESNFVYFNNRKTNQSVFKKCCDHFTDQPLQRCLSQAQHCKYCVKLNLIAVSNRGPITKPECQNCVFAAVKLLLLTAIFSLFFCRSAAIYISIAVAGHSRAILWIVYGVRSTKYLDSYKCCFTQKPVSYLNGLVRVFIGVG